MTKEEIYQVEKEDANSYSSEELEAFELLIVYYFIAEVKNYILNLSPINANDEERNLKSIIARKKILDKVPNNLIRDSLNSKITEISLSMVAIKMPFKSYLELLTGKENNEDIADSKEVDYIVFMYEEYSKKLSETLNIEENVIISLFQKDLIAYLDEKYK